MHSPATNMVANFVGRAWAMLLNLAVVPIYFQLLGVEAYGLIGFFATLQAAFGVIDMGLSLTLNREFARVGNTVHDQIFRRNLLRTFEVVYWGLSLCAGLLVACLAGWIAKHWITARGLPLEQIESALRAMGFVILLQTPLGLYQGGFSGLQRQVELNVILAVGALLRAAGAVLALHLVEPSIRVFFTWQVLVAAIVSLWFAVRLWAVLPRCAERVRFDASLLRNLWRFSIAVSVSAVLGLALTQLDKVVLSKLLSLEDFGYYALATTGAGLLWAVIVPLTTAFFPRFAQLAAQESTEMLANAYHTACQLLAALIMPSATIICVYAQDLLSAWTGNAQAASHAAHLLTMLGIGTALNGLASAASTLQSAIGWPGLVMHINAVLVLFMVPALLVGTKVAGATGAAAVWICVNLTYLVVMVPLMHRRVLRGHFGRWLRADVLSPLLMVSTIAIFSRWIYPTDATTWLKLVLIALLWLAMLLSAVAVLPNLRMQLLHHKEWPLGAALAPRGR